MMELELQPKPSDFEVYLALLEEAADAPLPLSRPPPPPRPQGAKAQRERVYCQATPLSVILERVQKVWKNRPCGVKPTFDHCSRIFSSYHLLGTHECSTFPKAFSAAGIQRVYGLEGNSVVHQALQIIYQM